MSDQINRKTEIIKELKKKSEEFSANRSICQDNIIKEIKEKLQYLEKNKFRPEVDQTYIAF